MPEYLSPGVYVEEIDTGNKPIEGVSTSTAGMLGVTERGPVNVPILITSYGDYKRWFGERLALSDFSSLATGPHCFVPHAVEGFFQNEGKRVYVTRVLDMEGAVNAFGQLFDRGADAAPSTVLLRTVSEQTGTEAALPRLYVLDTTGLAHDTWIRIGDGSAAEYRQVDVVVPLASNTHVALDSPLSRPHDAGATVEEFARAADGTFVGPITLVTPLDPQSQHLPVLPGDQAVTVTSATAADNTALIGGTGHLLEIGVAPTREFRFIVQATQTAPDQVMLRLDSPLTLTYQNGAVVTPLQIIPATAAIQTTALETSAGAGDPIIFVNNRGGNFVNPADLVIFDRANQAVREVRRVSALTTLAVPRGAYGDYAAGSLVEKITLDDDTRHITAAVASGVTSVNIDDVTSLLAGQKVLVGPLIGAELMVIQTVTLGVAPAGTVGFTAALANAHAAGELFRPVAKSMTAAATAGQSVLSLDDRLSLSPGDILRVDTGAAQEFTQIEAVPNRAPVGSAPDPGIVVLTAPLRVAHPAGTQVWREVSAAPAVPLAPTVLALDAQTGAAALQVTDGSGFVSGDSIRVTPPTGGLFFHLVGTVSPVANASEVSVQAPPLERAHHLGAIVTGRNPQIEVEAIDPGAWGNRLRISVEDEVPGLVARTQLSTIVDPTHIRLASTAGVEAGTILEFLDPLNGDAVISPLQKVVSVNRTTNFTLTLAGTGLTPAQQAAQVAAIGANTWLGVRSREFRITVLLMHQPDPSLPSRSEQVVDRELFRNLSIDSRHSRYFQTIIGDINGPHRLEDHRPEGESWYVRVHDLAQDLQEPNRTTSLESIRRGPETLRDILPNGRSRPARHALESGDDSIATLTDDIYIGADNVDPEQRTGLFSFVNIDEVSIISAPGRTSPLIQGALIDFCENNRYCFTVLDGPVPRIVWQTSDDSLADVQQQRQQFDTKYAALYHPWPVIPDPFPVSLAKIANYPIPPSGHVMGVYARTDIERGVHKVPANEVVNGIIGLQRMINKPEQDILNPYPVNINVIRDFRPNNRGIRIWGGRVITSDTDWKYVNVRRLLIFIEKSIDRGLQWVVFEPNAEPLWARVRRTIGNFLTTVWRNGGLEGTKPEEAYFVKCDRTTMTQTDIDNGKLIVVIGVAPVKPAEFVIIRIGLWTANSGS